MTTTVVRITAALPGILLAVSGVGWLGDPATAAEGLVADGSATVALVTLSKWHEKQLERVG